MFCALFAVPPDRRALETASRRPALVGTRARAPFDRTSSGAFRVMDDRRLVRRVGAGTRVNALGIALEVGVVRALDPPARGWSWALSFRPGF